MVASEAYQYPHGETGARYQAAADNCMANPNFVNQLNIKSIQDRIKNILEGFEIRGNDGHNRSATGGEISEIYNFLGEILKALKYSEFAKHLTAPDLSDQEEIKLATRQDMVLN